MRKEKMARSWRIKAMELLACGAIMLVPLVTTTQSIASFSAIKSFIALGVCCVMALLWVWDSWSVVRSREECAVSSFSWLHVALGVYMLVLAISACLGVDAHTSWFGTFLEGTGLMYLYAFIFFGIMVGSLARRVSSFTTRFFTAAFIGGVIVALVTYFGPEAIRGTDGGSTIGNTSFAGGYLLFIACIGTGLCIFYKSLWQKIPYIIGTLGILCSPVFLNESLWKKGLPFGAILYNPLLVVGAANGAALGLGLALVLAGGLWLTRTSAKSLRITGVSLCIVAVLAVGIGGYALVTPDTVPYREFVAEKSASRFVYWDIARAGFREHPLRGYGWGNYDQVFQKYFDPILFSPGYVIEPSLLDPHNAVWSYAATTGVFGVGAYTLLIGLAFIYLYKASDSDDRLKKIFGIMLAASMAGYIFQNMFVFDTPAVYLILFSVIGMASSFAPVRWSFRLTRRYSAIYGVAGVLVGLAAVTGFVLFAVMPWRESRAWFAYLTESGYEQATDPENLSLVGTANDIVYYGSNLYAQGKQKAITAEQKAHLLEKLRLIVKNLTHTAECQPDNYRVYLTKGILENGIVAFTDRADEDMLHAAHTDLLRAIELNPRTPEPYFNLAQTLVYERDFRHAYAYVRAGIALAPAYGEGYKIAETLLKIAPDKGFEKYVWKMKEKWQSQ